jgi:hypothetical protein
VGQHQLLERGLDVEPEPPFEGDDALGVPRGLEPPRLATFATAGEEVDRIHAEAERDLPAPGESLPVITPPSHSSTHTYRSVPLRAVLLA